MPKPILRPPEWNIQPKEHPNSYELFKIYKSLGQNRSTKNVVLALGTAQKNYIIESSRINALSIKWQWIERIRKYEEYLMNLEIADEIKARKEMNKRLAKHSEFAENALMIPIKEYLKSYNGRKINFGQLELEPDKFFLIVAKAAMSLSSVGEFERKIRGGDARQVNTNYNINLNHEDLSHEELIKKAKELGFERLNGSE